MMIHGVTVTRCFSATAEPPTATFCAVGDFLPPADIPPSEFEINNNEIFADKQQLLSSIVDNDCHLQQQRLIPIPVQDIMDSECRLYVFFMLLLGYYYHHHHYC